MRIEPVEIGGGIDDDPLSLTIAMHPKPEGGIYDHSR
jgi:hypothetical protein